MAVYELDDSQALEYVAGSSEGDYDEDGPPSDMLALLGENYMYDEDDYDDDLKEYDDYHMQLFDAPITTRSDDSSDTEPKTVPESGDDGTSAKKSDSSGGGSGAKPQPLPKSGDALGPLSGVAVAAAAAGAAFAAYSARRTHIAQEELADSQDVQDSQE